MLQSLFPKFVSQSNNQLFYRTRWRLAIWYAGIMGMVLVLSGFGVYKALIYAHRLTIERELEFLANELHETLEPILEEPGKLSPAAQKVLPDLCYLEADCLVAVQSESTILKPQEFYLRLFDIDGNLIAVAGQQPKDDVLAEQQNSIYSKQHPKHSVSLVLHTNEFRVWGSLQLGKSFSESEVYAISLRWIFLTSLLIAIALLIFISWYLAGRAMQPIIRSYQLLQQFTADAAHELRTPLAAIRATVESSLMMTTTTEAETKETLQTIGRQNARLSNLVADLLMLCRMDRQLGTIGASSQLKIVESVSLVNLVKDIAEDFAFLAVESQINLKTKLLLSESVRVRGNYEQLYRMVSNLVANALQYTLPKGKVNLLLTRHGKYALLKIQDNGIGIAPQDLDKIFVRFYRVGSDRSRHHGGSGLGLSIAYAIAQAHQGNIQVTSQLGRGSTFVVYLPIVRNLSNNHDFKRIC